MNERLHDPARTEKRRAQAEPDLPAHELLVLQRRLGNQAVQRLVNAGGTLARKEQPAPARTPIAPVTHLYGITTAEEWEAHLNAGKGSRISTPRSRGCSTRRSSRTSPARRPSTSTAPFAPLRAFRAWLRTQSIAAADLALIRERIDNSNVNTEVLAHLEGSMAGFPHESAAAAKSSRAAYGELHEAAAHWDDSDPAVQQEVSGRLRQFKARLKGDRLTTFRADLQRLKSENGKLAALIDPLL